MVYCHLIELFKKTGTSKDVPVINGFDVNSNFSFAILDLKLKGDEFIFTSFISTIFCHMLPMGFFFSIELLVISLLNKKDNDK